MTEKTSLDTLTKFFIATLGIVAIVIVLKELQNLFLPFVIAYFLYFLFVPLNKFLTSKKIPLAIAGLLDIAITFTMTWFAGKFIIDSLMSFSSELDLYDKKLSAMVMSTATSIGISDPALNNFSIQSLLKQIDYGSLAGGLLTSTIDLMGYALFVIFFFSFILPGHKAIYRAIEKRVVSPKKFEIIKRKQLVGDESGQSAVQPDHDLEEETTKLEKTFKTIPEQIQKYIITKLVLNILAGVTVGVVLGILGVPFPAVWGAFTAILNFIPTIGSAFATILPALMSLVDSGEITFTLLVVGCMAGIQTLYFNLLEPMIVGKRLNLNPLVILFSVIIWGYIWGIMGMFLAVPLTAILKIVISNFDSKNMQFISDLMGSND
ncbi:MAG: AI-2E family transporter [Ignavibacteria bacterium]|nr:AI-2E family transporter [Ignavibacteria bacterium]